MFADDIRTIADALDVERLAVWGISGGGPHALACGALASDRVVAVASLAAVAPYDADGLDWLAGMGQMNVDEFGAAVRGSEALEEHLEGQARDVAATTGDGIVTALEQLLTPVDARALSGEIGDYLAKCEREAVRQGVAGWRDDDLAFAKPWGFSVEEINIPVLLWHGEHDLFVPFAHGEWLAERIPNVDAHLSDEDGHLTLLHRVPDVHAWLLERL
jgi:pimeloyl-ACP methyl ester carboxylesterase